MLDRRTALAPAERAKKAAEDSWHEGRPECPVIGVDHQASTESKPSHRGRQAGYRQREEDPRPSGRRQRSPDAHQRIVTGKSGIREKAAINNANSMVTLMLAFPGDRPKYAPGTRVACWRFADSDKGNSSYGQRQSI